MATQKEMREMRENVINQLSEIEIVGFEYVGQITDGVLLHNTDLDSYLVLKPIAKKEDFDSEDALEEFEDKQAKALEREQARLEKAVKRAEKAKAKLEEEGE